MKSEINFQNGQSKNCLFRNMAEQGWIKLYRKLLRDPIFTSDKGLKVWVWCLLRANHKKTEVFLGRQKILLKRGQFIFGRYSASEMLKIPPSTVWFWIKELKNGYYIDIKTTNKFSIITIKNWGKYQNSLTPKEQQRDTDNNDKNVKKFNEITTQEISIIKKIKEKLSQTEMNERMLSQIINDTEFLKDKKKQLLKHLSDKKLENPAGYIVRMYQFWKDNEK